MLVIALILEAFLLLWVVFISVLGAMGEQGAIAQNLSLVAVAVLSLVWVVVTLIGAIRSKASWARGSAITIHVLLFAAGTGMLQTQLGSPLLGFCLIALAIIGFFAAIVARPMAKDAFESEGSPEVR